MKKLCIIVLLLILTKCFDINLFNNNYLNLIDITILLVFALLEYGKGGFCAKSILLFSFLVMISVVNSFISHKQNIITVLFRSYFALGLLSFFIPLHYKLSSEFLTKIIILFSIIFCVCYIIQWQIYPMVIFKGAMDEISISEAQFRMRMPCSICSYLLFFFGLSRYFLKKKGIYLLYSLLGFVPMIIMGFRSLLLLSAICVAYLFIYYTYKKTKGFLYYLISFAIIGVVLFQTPIVQDKIDEMEQRQEKGGFFVNDDYKRIVSFYYYSNEVFNSHIDHFFGGGVPIVSMNNLYSHNQYAGKVCRGYTYGLYWNDLGLIGLGFIIGFPSVIVILFIILRVVYRCRNDKLIFVSCTLLTVLLGSIFTTQELYRSGNFIIIGLLLYLEYIYSKENSKEKTFLHINK